MPEPAHRRDFLRYIGYAAGGVALGPLAGCIATGRGAWTRGNGAPDWEPVAYPLPLPGDGGNAEGDRQRFKKFTVRDELVVPAGFRYDVLASWRDTFGARGHEIRFGYNCDYTGLVALPDAPGEYLLLVNHEYISARAWLQGLVEDGASFDIRYAESGKLELKGQVMDPVVDPAELQGVVLEELKAMTHQGMDDLGISVLHLRRSGDRFEVIRNSRRHRRCSGVGAYNWNQGAHPTMSGPVLRVPGMQGFPPRTFSNCSGGTSPWGTILTCEENVQQQVPEHVTPEGRLLNPDHARFTARSADALTGLPKDFGGMGRVADPDIDGRSFGWVVEVDPLAGRLCKHSALGRLRHENVSLRCEAGKKLAAYMGDDRRGGHVWKFVSDRVVEDPAARTNSALLEKGTLYAAAFEPDFTGRWVAIRPDSPLARPRPERTVEGFMWLPRRPEGGHVRVGAVEKAELSVEAWMASVATWTRKPYADSSLGDLVSGEEDETRQGIILLDAFAMANAAGATPSSRPEDVEVHPLDASVYVAFTDNTGSGEGSPDQRIFPDSAKSNSRQYGAIYRMEETGDDPAAERFTWGRFVSSGEAAEGGGGFACADNLAFDPAGNLWVVSDISTSAHNFPVTREEGSKPGDKNFAGVFGNNALFCIPTTGPLAGVPHCFAIGPMECEMTGPTFSDDGTCLILSIQHPGERHGARGLHHDAEVTRTVQIAGRDGTLIEQERTVPLGSNFPSGEKGQAPRPSVVCITRKS